jgi:Domain of unknown function DUF11
MSCSLRVSLSFSIALLASFVTTAAWATPPVLYTQPAYESAVRGDPDELLLLSGSGLSGADVVVYQAIANTLSPLPAPASIPTQSSSTKGVLAIVNSADAPYAITVHLPSAMTAGGSYAIQVVDPAGEWSAPALINDARPLWITPDSGFQTASLANLPRVLKVVGRNLQPSANVAATQVRLTGANTGTTYTLTAHNASNDSANTTTALERYVAAVNLPSPMVVDNYTVAVNRDGVSWIPLLGNGQTPAQLFTVNLDPAPVTPAKTFSVGSFADPLTGNTCQPNDGVDDTGCIVLAIRAAQMAGGGTVVFGPGTWLMSQAGTWNGQGYSNRTGYQPGHCPSDPQTCGVGYFGVIVPIGVDLQGAGATGTYATIIERAACNGCSPNAGWPTTMPLFTFQGSNTVGGFYFQDDNDYLTNYADQTFGGAQLQLGLTWYFAHMWSATDPLTLSNVTITNNVFDKPWEAITNGGLPIDHVYITDNVFGGAFNTAIGVGEDENNIINLSAKPLFPYQVYHWQDTVVDYNTFYPSSFQVTAAAYNSGAPGGNGSIATGFNSGLRSDFSSNVADGTSTEYLYNPTTDPKGFRAAFFWSIGAGQEMTLTSSNSVSCSGDKYGDGEAIVYDGDGTHGGVPSAESVTGTTAWTDAQGIPGSSLTAQGPLATQFTYSGGTLNISSNPTPYYQGMWLQVVSGMGQGQWRKIESAAVGSNANGVTFTLNVTPAFDVPPDGTSEILVGRVYWQNATVDNTIDQSTPLCTKANARDSGGTMSWYGSTADSAMEGNQQYGTSGILLNHTYQPLQPSVSPATPGDFVIQSHNEVRNNLVSGAYDWSSAGRMGGIQLGFGATGWYCGGNTCPAPPPVNTGLGVSIAGNTVSQASSRDADGTVHPPIGAIGLNPGWTTGYIDALGLAMWELDDDSLIFHNTLLNISNTVSGSAGGMPLVGIGIDVARGSTANPPVNWRATLYGDSCTNVDSPVSDFGLSTTRYCPAGNAGSCECAGAVNDDVGVMATESAGTVSAGGSVIYTVTVTNNDPTITASDVALAITPSAGVQMSGASYTPSQGTCDSAVNICMLGSIPAGTSATLTVVGVLGASGTWPVTFTVTHHEIDTNPTNNDTTVTTTVP